MKKMYFAPEVEEIELELQNALLEMSTDNGENNSDEIDDI
jgi:hypothetical protein